MYKGIEQISRWFGDWNRKGTVLQWDIKRVIVSGNTAVVEWYFNCDYEGNVDGFDGVTIAEFNADMKICDLKEFQSKAKHYYPYGERVNSYVKRSENVKDFENLVSIQELRQQISAAKLFSIFLSREQRKQRKDIEDQLNSLLNQMGLFSERFSPLGWCMYDSMSVVSLTEDCDRYFHLK